MTQDELFELANQAGKEAGLTAFVFHPVVEIFAKLVAAKEREACAQVCEDLPAPDTYSNTDMSMWDVTCIDCATAIRARG
jgi:hypothetical protein